MFSLSSLSVFILVCFKSTQHCPTTTQSPLPQPITTHHNPWYSNHKINQKQRKIKPKINLNPKQTFNGKLNNLEPKIKLSTKNPSTQTQIEAAVVTTTMESLLLLCSWRACYCHERGEKQVLESHSKGKDKKKNKKKKWREKTVGEEVEKRCDFVRKKRGSNIMGWG